MVNVNDGGLAIALETDLVDCSNDDCNDKNDGNDDGIWGGNGLPVVVEKVEVGSWTGLKVDNPRFLFGLLSSLNVVFLDGDGDDCDGSDVVAVLMVVAEASETVRRNFSACIPPGPTGNG